MKRLLARIFGFNSRAARRNARPPAHKYRPGFDCLEARTLLSAAVVGDFNGDGFKDWAEGLQSNPIGAVQQAGEVRVTYGSASGLGAAASQLWSQHSPGIQDTAEQGDGFGSSLVVGDFNGDGRDDLAVGVSGEDLGSIMNAGAVHIIYGSVLGLNAAGNQLWSQDSPGIQGMAESSDWFGSSLAVGDFNGDGRDDLAVGVPNENAPIGAEGVVNVIYGSASGLTTAGNQLWSQDSPSIQGTAEVGDYFGSSLAVGDFNGDHRDDLTVVVLGEAVGAVRNAGAVNVIYGSAYGLTAAGNQLWSQDSPGIQGSAEQGDGFGSSLAAGDFNRDGRDDLAVGVPGEDLGSIMDAGAVNVIYGSVSGLTAAGNQLWSQDSPGIQGSAEQGDLFGSSLAVGDFNGDTRADLAIGVPFDDSYFGAVNVIYGSASGLGAAGNQLWTLDSWGVPSTVKTGYFGLNFLVAGDFNGDGRADLAVSIWDSVIGNTKQILYGAPQGLAVFLF